MRRWGIGMMVIGLVVTSMSTALAGGGTAYYEDDFPSVSYSGSTGSLSWSSTPWQEYNDDGSVSTGNVYVALAPDDCADGVKCLHLHGEGLLAQPVGARRYADTTVLETAELSFDLTTSGNLLGAILTVYVTDGGSWAPVKVYGPVPGSASPTIDVTGYISEDFGVRFEIQGVLIGEAFIDRVRIEGPLVASSTTTTTTPATTTSTKPTTTSTSSPTKTTTTKPGDTTTTTHSAEGTTSTTRPPDEGSETTSTTTPGASTTTTGVSGETGGERADEELAPVTGSSSDTPPPGSGLRLSSTGAQFDLQTGMMGDTGMMEAEVLGVGLDADYLMAVEVFEHSWVWMIGLLLIVSGAVVTGLDWKRTRRLQTSL